MKQTILGAGGDVSNLLAKELTCYTSDIRLAARNPKKVLGQEELVKGSLLDADFVMEAVRGSAVVYLTVGLDYKTKVWKEQWPKLAQNVVNACKIQGCKLVFLDNVYLYDKNFINHMTEETPVNPSSEKGKARAEVVKILEKAMPEQEIVIGRSADFYGANCKNGVLNVLVINNLLNGKTPMWECDVNRIHSFTHIDDISKSLAILGNSENVCGQSWHLPTSEEIWTGQTFIDNTAELLNKKPKSFVLKNWMMKSAGIFVPLMKELSEMSYQYSQDYFFDSSKFKNRFQYTPKNYLKGLKEALKTVE